MYIIYVIFKCQNIWIKKQDIYLSKSYILVSSKPSKTIEKVCRYI